MKRSTLKEDARETDFNLSFHDLLMVDGFRQAIETGATEPFLSILFQNGMNVDEGYEIVNNTHRTLQNKVFSGNLVHGYERTDAAWIATGCASMAARIRAVKDLDLRTELRLMSYQGGQHPSNIDL